MGSHSSRATRVVLLAAMAWSLAIALPGAAAASAVCPPLTGGLAQLISADATASGPLSEAFPPIYGRYAEAAAQCWGDEAITVRGFVSSPEGLGGTQTYAIKPDWLVSRSHWLSVSDKVHADSGPVGPFFAVAVPSALEKRFTRLTGRWVRVTGHFHDPAAATCTVDVFGDPSLAPSTEQAVEICRTSFVVTAIRADDLPATNTDPSMTISDSTRVVSPAVALVTAFAFLVALRRFGTGRSGRR